MNEEVASSEAQATPEAISASVQRSGFGGGLPPWLPLAALAVVPALFVGILVFALAGGDSGGGGGGAAGILEAFLLPSADANTQVDSFKGRLPPEFPADFPVFRNADPVVSFSVVTPEGTTHRAILTTSASAEDVFNFYQEVLDEDPWQVEIGQSSDEVIGLQFSRPDNADVSGVVIVHESDLDGTTSIQLVYEDVSAALTPGTGASGFQLGQSRPLPPGFPQDVPVYKADSGTIVLDTGFQRGQGGRVFAITFVTKDSQKDVIDFYTNEFKNLGWTTSDTSPGGTSFAVSIDFKDKNQTVSGEVTADTFQEDSKYTQVQLVVQVTSGRGNQGN